MAKTVVPKSDDLYDCQVCLTYMMDKNPRTLACVHTFCEDCLQKLLNNKTIQCPTCRYVTTLPENDVKMLPVNFLLNEMKDKMKDMDDKMKEVISEMESVAKLNEKPVDTKEYAKCDVCVSYKATYKCKECMQIMCSLCKTKHDSISFFKSHILHKITASSFCEQHRNKVTHSCLKCAKHLCMKCMLFDHVEHSEFYEFHNKAAEKFEIEMMEMKSKLKGSLVTLEKKKDDLQENTGKIENMRRMLNQELEYHKRKCSEISTQIKELNRKSEQHEQILDDFTQTRESCEATLENLSKKANNTESDICNEYAELNVKVDEALKMIETILNKTVEIPTYMFDVDWMNDQRDPEESTEIKELSVRKLLVTLKSSDSIRCKGQMATFGSHVLSVTDLKPYHVVRLNEKGKLIARYYPEKETDPVIGVNVFKNKIYIVQEKGIRVIHTRTNGKDMNMFYQLQLHKDSKICVIDDSNILFTSPVEGSVYLYNIKDNTREVMVNNLKYPTYLSTAKISEGRVYLVTERDANLIKLYGSEWKLLNQIGDRDSKLRLPQATVITEMGTILMCDEDNLRISHFRLDATLSGHVVDLNSVNHYPHGLAYKYPYLWTSRLNGAWLKCFELVKTEIQ